jgi:hypothetical protein
MKKILIVSEIITLEIFTNIQMNIQFSQVLGAGDR